MRPQILYVGQLWEGGTCLERMKALASLGCQIKPFDTTPWLVNYGRWKLTVAHRLNFGEPVSALNHALQHLSGKLKVITHVWIDKGRWIYPQTLRVLKDETNATLVHYTPDPQLVHHKSRHFLASLPLYDLVVTTKPFEVDQYTKAGARKVLLVLQGYDSRVMNAAPSRHDREIYGSDVCIIGHYERHYGNRLRAAATSSGQLRIWGPRWMRYAFFHPWAKPYVGGDGLWGSKYCIALKCSKIALGLLSKRIPETTTTRTFEIPAAGAFLLAERTEDHLNLFDEGKEAEFFGSDEELKDKIAFYSREEPLRSRIAQAGHSRCIKSGYHTRNELEKVLKAIA